MDNNAVYTFQGESFMSRFIGIVALLIVIFLSISSILKLSPLGLSVGFGMLIITFLFIHYKVIINVQFYNEFIIVRHLLKSKKISINSIINIYKNQEGFIPTHVYVIRYKNDKKVKKITFYCDVNKFENNLSNWLIEKGISLKR